MLRSKKVLKKNVKKLRRHVVKMLQIQLRVTQPYVN